MPLFLRRFALTLTVTVYVLRKGGFYSVKKKESGHRDTNTYP